MVFSQLIINILNSDGNSLGGGFLVIIIMIFMRQAETIIRTIFGFGNAKSLGDVVAAGALVASSVSAAGKTLGALKGSQKESKGGSGGSSSKGADKKPNLKDTSNAGGAQKQTSNSGGSNAQNGNSNSGGGSNSYSGGNDSSSNSGGSNDSSNTSSGADTSSGGNNSSSTNYGSTDIDTVSTVDRSYNTEAVQDAESKFKNVLSKYANANIKAIEVAAGIGLGGAMKGDIPTMIAGANFAKAGVNVAKLGGNKVISGFKNTTIAKNSRINQKTDKVIDAYDNLKAEKGWSDDRMLDETERVLDIKDTSTIKNEKLREYAETVQELRTEYEGEYKVPNDMVLDRVSKIQSGEVKKDNSKKYTKKPKTRPIDRRSRRKKPNGQNGSSN